MKPWPIRGCDLYLVGEIRPTSSKKRIYTLVGIDYFTKWIKAIQLVNIDQEAVIDFIQRHIIFQFGIHKPLQLIKG